MRSLQFRLPLIVIGVLAVSLAFSAFVMYETLLLTDQRRLDDSVEREFLRAREALALTLPAALAGSSAAPPSSAELVETMDAYLAERSRDEATMTIVRAGSDLLTTDDAPTTLELLRDEGRLPVAVEDADGSITTVASARGDLRIAALDVRATDGDPQVLVAGSLSDVRDAAVRSLARISAAAGIGLIVAAGLLVVGIRRVLRPLSSLASTARASELQALGARVELTSSTNEVGLLAAEFNRMLDRLERSVDDQRRFMASVSHELRTPITIARGHLELLEDRSRSTATAATGSDATVDDVVDLVRAELLTMQRLVADLMTLGHAGEEDFVHLEAVRLRELFDELHLRIVGLGTHGVRFAAVPDDVVQVDPDRLAQAVLNLVTNAAVHAPTRTRIIVGALSDDTALVVYVDDDGAGIDERVLGSLFEPFVRSESAHGSTGLGLSVVRAVAEAHGGTVEVTTTELGTRVGIRIPQATATPRTGDRVLEARS